MNNQRVTEISKKSELIPLHTCKRSFYTNMYLSGFPNEELMIISGHKSSIAFMQYIKADNFQSAYRVKT